MTAALGEIASRIDHGFSFEVRAAKAAAPAKDQPESEDDVIRRQMIDDTAAEITARNAELNYLKVQGPSILSLAGLHDADVKKSTKQPQAG